MTTRLHEVAGLTRKLFLFGIIGFAILAIGSIVWQGVKAKFFPTPPAVPTVLYGTLPPIQFPKQELDLNCFWEAAAGHDWQPHW